MLLDFNELGPGQQVELTTNNSGSISGIAVASPGSGSVSPLAPQPASLQGGLIVDPANVTGVATSTGTATGTSDGIAGRVFNSWANLVAAWGTTAPVFNVPTQIVFASANAATDPIYFYPKSTVQTTVVLRTPTTLVTIIALATVTAKNRTAGANAVLSADLGAGRVTGQLLVNTTRGNSVSRVETLVAGTTWNLCQPFTPFAPPSTATPSEVDTWANGDTVEVRSMISLVVGAIVPTLLGPGFASTSNYVSVYRCNLTSPVGIEIGAVACIESNSANSFFPVPSTGVSAWVNHFWSAGGILSLSYQGTRIIGGALAAGAAITLCSRQSNVDGDLILRGVLSLSGVHSVGLVFIGTSGEMITVSDGRALFSNLFFGAHVIYGVAGATINVRGTSVLSMTGTYTAGFTAPALITPGVQLNGTSTGSSNDNGNPVSVIAGNIGTTVAALDAAVGAAGFGGVAFKLGGASVRNTA